MQLKLIELFRYFPWRHTGCDFLILIQESAFLGFVPFPDTLDSVGNIILQKSDCTSKLPDTVKVSNQTVIRVNDLLVLILQGKHIGFLQDDGIRSQEGCLHRLSWGADPNILPEWIFFDRYLAYKKAVANFKAIRRELLRDLPCIQTFRLIVCILDGCRGDHVLRLDPIMRAQILYDGFISTIDRPKRPCDQMKLILDDQFWREERFDWHYFGSRKSVFLVMTLRMFYANRNISIAAALTVNPSEKGIRLLVPRQSCELVDRWQDDGRAFCVDFLVHQIYWNRDVMKLKLRTRKTSRMPW